MRSLMASSMFYLMHSSVKSLSFRFQREPFATEILCKGSRQLVSNVVSFGVIHIIHRIYSSGNRKVLDIRDSTDVENQAEGTRGVLWS